MIVLDAITALEAAPGVDVLSSFEKMNEDYYKGECGVQVFWSGLLEYGVNAVQTDFVAMVYCDASEGDEILATAVQRVIDALDGVAVYRGAIRKVPPIRSYDMDEVTLLFIEA